MKSLAFAHELPLLAWSANYLTISIQSQSHFSQDTTAVNSPYILLEHQQGPL